MLKTAGEEQQQLVYQELVAVIDAFAANVHMCVYLYLYISIYIYLYIYRNLEKSREYSIKPKLSNELQRETLLEQGYRTQTHIMP